MPIYEVQVAVNPNGQPPRTVPNTEIEPFTSAEKGYNKTMSLQSIAKAALGSSIVVSAGRLAVGSIGDLTGNQQLQKDINEVLKYGGAAAGVLGAGVLVGTGAGALAAGVFIAQETTDTIRNRIKIRNDNVSTEYNSKLNGNRVGGNR